MNRDVKREGGALQRIVALLIALASLAERAAATPFARRALVLAILRHAESVAWAFALGTPCVSTAFARNHRQLQCATLPVAPVGGDDCAAELARMAFSLRLLALLIANWVVKVLSATTAPLRVRCAMAEMRPGSGASWRGPAALPAPDTS